MNNSTKKESRRSFIKDKLWKGFLLSIAGTLPPFARAHPSDDVSSLDIYKSDNKSIDWDKVASQFTISPQKEGIPKRHNFNTGSLGSTTKISQNTLIAETKLLDSITSEMRHRIEPARSKIANLLNVDRDTIAITRNTTEGMNIISRSIDLQKGDEVLLTSEEHIGGAACWIALEKQMGIRVKIVPVCMNGSDVLENIKKHVTSKTKVISVSHVTSNTGLVLPVKSIIDYCRRQEIISCIDGAQAVGQVEVNIDYLKPDFYVTSGHKWLFGPVGSGVLYINRSFLNNNPPHYWGAYTDSAFALQKKELDYKKEASREEYGTRNTAAVVAFGAAVDFILTIDMKRIEQRCQELSQRFRLGIENHKKIKIHTPKGQAAMIAFSIEGKNNKEVCLSLINGPEVILRSIHENDLNSIRASFSIANSLADVDYLVGLLLDIADTP